MIYQDKPDLDILVDAYIYSEESDLDELAHYGVKRRSGRYPWGSGDTPYQHSGDFISRVDELRKSGFTYTDPETGKVYKGDTAIAKYIEPMLPLQRMKDGKNREKRLSLCGMMVIPLKKLPTV